MFEEGVCSEGMYSEKWTVGLAICLSALSLKSGFGDSRIVQLNL
jgi:hypothetical protein